MAGGWRGGRRGITYHVRRPPPPPPHAIKSPPALLSCHASSFQPPTRQEARRRLQPNADPTPLPPYPPTPCRLLRSSPPQLPLSPSFSHTCQEARRRLQPYTELPQPRIMSEPGGHRTRLKQLSLHGFKVDLREGEGSAGSRCEPGGHHTRLKQLSLHGFKVNLREVCVEVWTTGVNQVGTARGSSSSRSMASKST